LESVSTVLAVGAATAGAAATSSFESVSTTLAVGAAATDAAAASFFAFEVAFRWALSVGDEVLSFAPAFGLALWWIEPVLSEPVHGYASTKQMSVGM
jgi:hypothetical protein